MGREGVLSEFSDGLYGAVDCDEIEGMEPFKPLADVGVTGLAVELVFEVGELKSFEPVDALVRFFFRNPKLGI